ncbi:MAG: MBL fold metallo-hydrolase [Xanthomonadales bacterium]|nr:hypothetical protein [Xanthomonadales bacterium]MCC6593357.1 MBL fold metallo-hydrolase [Xanthomonadales bacterium]
MSLRLCCCALLLATARGPVCAAGDAEATPVPVERVAQHVYLLRGAYTSGRQPDGNTVLFTGGAGWIVFDTGRHPEHSERILDFVRASGARVDAIVNSHWHLDHIGGNARIRANQPDVRIYASPAVDLAFATGLKDYRSRLQSRIDDPKSRAADRQAWRREIALIDSAAQLRPDVRIGGTRDRQIAGLRMRFGLEVDAVTGGDVWIYDRRSRVLAAGDLVTLPVPFFDTACAVRWSAALAGLEDLPFERLVPGHGAVLGRHQYTRYRMAFDALLGCAAGSAPASVCADAWIAATGDLYAASDQPRAREMLGSYFSQRLRAPAEQRDRHCPP